MIGARGLALGAVRVLGGVFDDTNSSAIDESEPIMLMIVLVVVSVACGQCVSCVEPSVYKVADDKLLELEATYEAAQTSFIAANGAAPAG